MRPNPIPVAAPVKAGPSRAEAAVAFLDQAVKAGCQDASVLYMLALAHKRQGKIQDARNALRKITNPDANVILQMALLSLSEDNLPQAEGELLKAWQMDQTCYETCYNLVLTQLTLGKLPECAALIPQGLRLLEQRAQQGQNVADEVRFLQILGSLLQAGTRRDGEAWQEQGLADLSPADEGRLLKIIRSLGQLDTVHKLLRILAEARQRSGPVREAYFEAVLVKAKHLMDRCQWTEAELLLQPVARERGLSRAHQLTVVNLLGCCLCLTQDFDGAVRHFQSAVKIAPSDPRLHQNLALAWELKGDLGQADPAWNRFFDLLGDQVPAPPDIPGYVDRLTYESLSRLASRYTEKEKWSSALTYVQRAAQHRPNDPDVLERMFHLYNQAKRPSEARRTLDQLRRLRPGEPQYELYELDLIEVKGLNDIERLLTDIDRIRQRYPGDARVEERAVSMVGNVIPLMHNLCDQLTEQMNKVTDQVRHLPNYQINWSAVREVMHDLMREFQKLRRIVGKCLPLVANDEQRRIVRDLADHIDEKMEACRSMGA